MILLALPHGLAELTSTPCKETRDGRNAAIDGPMNTDTTRKKYPSIGISKHGDENALLERSNDSRLRSCRLVEEGKLIMFVVCDNLDFDTREINLNWSMNTGA